MRHRWAWNCLARNTKRWWCQRVLWGISFPWLNTQTTPKPHLSWCFFKNVGWYFQIFFKRTYFSVFKNAILKKLWGPNIGLLTFCLKTRVCFGAITGPKSRSQKLNNQLKSSNWTLKCRKYPICTCANWHFHHWSKPPTYDIF